MSGVKLCERIRQDNRRERDAPRNQRHTARRVHQHLVAEYGPNVTESTVRPYVAQVQLGLDTAQRLATVPQPHGSGEEAEVDFGGFVAFVDGVAVKCWMFCMRLLRSGRGFQWDSPTRPRGVRRGHVDTFAYFGAVPGASTTTT